MDEPTEPGGRSPSPLLSGYPGCNGSSWGWAGTGAHRGAQLGPGAERLPTWRTGDTVSLTLDTREMALSLAVCRANGDTVRAPGPLLLGSKLKRGGAAHFAVGRYHGRYKVRVLSLRRQNSAQARVELEIRDGPGSGARAHGRWSLPGGVPCAVRHRRPEPALASEAAAMLRQLACHQPVADALAAALAAVAVERPSAAACPAALGALHALGAAEECARRGAGGTSAEAGGGGGPRAVQLLEPHAAWPAVASYPAHLGGDEPTLVSLGREAMGQLALALPPPPAAALAASLLPVLGRLLALHAPRCGLLEPPG